MLSRRVALVVTSAFLLPLLLGQACGVPAPAPQDRLASNAELRAACSGLMMSDADIDQFLQLIEARREQGESRLQALQRWNLICAAEPGPGCDSCYAAMINQVYE
jgi:hypothetical protein